MTTRTAYGRRPAWPFRLLGWVVTMTLVLLMVLMTGLAAFVIGVSVHYELTRTKASDLDQMIEERLTPGATADQVISVLDSEGIEHGAVEPSPGDDLRLLEAGVPKGTMVISAIVRNDGHSLELVDVKMTFILDENGTLKDHVVYEVHHRPSWLGYDVDRLGLKQ